MDDNEKVAPLLDGLLREVNASCLPPAVKELEEENVLQLIQAAITMEKGGGTNG